MAYRSIPTRRQPLTKHKSIPMANRSTHTQPSADGTEVGMVVIATRDIKKGELVIINQRMDRGYSSYDSALTGFNFHNRHEIINCLLRLERFLPEGLTELFIRDDDYGEILRLKDVPDVYNGTEPPIRARHSEEWLRREGGPHV